MDDRSALEGHVSPASELAPRVAFDPLSPLVRPLVCYAPLDPWELDTASLPPALARHRRQMRAFAERHLAPVALGVDAEPHRLERDAKSESSAMGVLCVAGREGLLSDMLPAPFGSADPRLFAHPLHLTASLKTEELAAVDGGLMLLVCAHSLGVAPVLLSGDPSAVRRRSRPLPRTSPAASSGGIRSS